MRILVTVALLAYGLRGSLELVVHQFSGPVCCGAVFKSTQQWNSLPSNDINFTCYEGIVYQEYQGKIFLGLVIYGRPSDCKWFLMLRSELGLQSSIRPLDAA